MAPRAGLSVINVTVQPRKTEQSKGALVHPAGAAAYIIIFLIVFRGRNLLIAPVADISVGSPRSSVVFFPNSCTFFEISGAESKILPVDIRLISLNPRSSSSVALKRRMEDWGDDPLDIHRRDSALAHPLYWGHDK